MARQVLVVHGYSDRGKTARPGARGWRMPATGQLISNVADHLHLVWWRTAMMPSFYRAKLRHGCTRLQRKVPVKGSPPENSGPRMTGE